MAISIGQLDLEALKNYLKIVHGFRTVNDPSNDTDHVAGIDSELIATIANIQDPVLKEELGRKIVDYSLNLIKIKEDNTIEYISGDSVLTEEEGSSLKEAALEATRNTANDMRSLRNEMYHIKRDMMKSGAIAYDRVYDGYIDPFLDGLDLYTLDTLKIDTVDGANSISIESGDIDAYNIGQYAAIISEGDILTVEPIHDKYSSELTLGDKMFIFPSPGPDSISKSYGVYDKGRFVFGNEKVNLSQTDDAVNMIYKDGPDRLKIAELNHAGGIAGFGSTIVVPAGLDENYLKGISVSLRTSGSPGSCHLELYNYNDETKYGDPIAVSNYLNAGNASDVWGTYKFTFDNEIFLEKGAMYLLVVRSSGTDKLNKWFVGGFTEPCNENKHQDTYIFQTEGTIKKESPDIITNQVYDMFIGLYTTATERLKLNYSKQGIYTGSFEIEHNQASRVRVSFNPRKSNEHYIVKVKGKNLEGKIIDGKMVGTPLRYSHSTWVNGEKSADEFAYDFVFKDKVTFVEFQIIFNSPVSVGEENYEALFAVVVSTDNASLTKEEE